MTPTFTPIELSVAADHGFAMPIPEGPQMESIRKRSGLSTTQLAAAVGVTARTIENYERGRTAGFGSPAIGLRVGRVLSHLEQAARIVHEERQLVAA